MRAIGYIRVSTGQQAKEGISLDAQESKIRSWADLNGYEDVVICRDAGISGSKTTNRDGLQSALNMIQKGDALIVYSLSRLARSTKDTIEISESLQDKGADLVSISERIDTTSAAGKMVFRMLAVLNEFERDLVSERTKAVLQYKKDNFEKTGGDVPFGFDATEDGKLTENQAEQKAISLIKSLKNKGYSLRKIAQELELECIQTKTGKSKWHPQAVKRILARAA